MRPSLQLNFAATKRLDPRIMFSRASSATYFDAFGQLKTAPANTARFDHDPITGECKGLLIEEARTNLLTRSIPDAAVPTGWTTPFDTGSFSRTLVPAPYALAGVQQFIRNEQTVTGRSFVSQNFTATAGVTYTLSVYFDKANSSISSGDRTVMAVTSTIGFSGVVGCSVDSIPSDGRASITFTAIGSGTVNVRVGVGVINVATGTLIFGAWQLEAGSFPTSYIPTTTAQATRAADIAQMGGANFSSWYRQDEGTFVVDYTPIGIVLAFRYAFSVGDGTTSNYAGVNSSNSTPIAGLRVTSGGASQASISVGTPTLERTRIAVAIKENDFAISRDGGAAATDTAGVMPVGVSQLSISSSIFATQVMYIARISYFPDRLSNTELQALSA